MEPARQARLIRRLLREQDEVLEQIDALNARIEQALRELVPPRESGERPPQTAAAA